MSRVFPGVAFRSQSALQQRQEEIPVLEAAAHRLVVAAAALPRDAAERPAFAWPMRSMATPFVSIALCRQSSRMAFSISTDAWPSEPSSTMMMRSGRTVWATRRRRALPPTSGRYTLSPANADACALARAWCGLWW